MDEPIEIVKKLRVRAGSRLRLVGVPPVLAAALTAGGEVETVRGDEASDAIIGFCQSPADVALVADSALPLLEEDGLVWLAYRKGRPEFNRDRGWEAMDAKGWRPVSQVAIDNEWSALRFKPRDKVVAKPGSRFA